MSFFSILDSWPITQNIITKSLGENHNFVKEIGGLLVVGKFPGGQIIGNPVSEAFLSYLSLSLINMREHYEE